MEEMHGDLKDPRGGCVKNGYEIKCLAAVWVVIRIRMLRHWEVYILCPTVSFSLTILFQRIPKIYISTRMLGKLENHTENGETKINPEGPRIVFERNLSFL